MKILSLEEYYAQVDIRTNVKLVKNLYKPANFGIEYEEIDVKSNLSDIKLTKCLFFNDKTGEPLNGYYAEQDGLYCSYLDGFLHSYNDIPAVIATYSNCYKWLKNGLEHRSGDLPAIIDFDRFIAFYEEGLLNRKIGYPASIDLEEKCFKFYSFGGKYLSHENVLALIEEQELKGNINSTKKKKNLGL